MILNVDVDSDCVGQEVVIGDQGHYRIGGVGLHSSYPHNSIAQKADLNVLAKTATRI